MDKELFKRVTNKKWLSDKELDEKRKRMVEKSYYELDDEWKNEEAVRRNI